MNKNYKEFFVQYEQQVIDKINENIITDKIKDYSMCCKEFSDGLIIGIKSVSQLWHESIEIKDNYNPNQLDLFEIVTINN